MAIADMLVHFVLEELVIAGGGLQRLVDEALGGGGGGGGGPGLGLGGLGTMGGRG